MIDTITEDAMTVGLAFSRVPRRAIQPDELA